LVAGWCLPPTPAAARPAPRTGPAGVSFRSLSRGLKALLIASLVLAVGGLGSGIAGMFVNISISSLGGSFSGGGYSGPNGSPFFGGSAIGETAARSSLSGAKYIFIAQEGQLAAALRAAAHRHGARLPAARPLPPPQPPPQPPQSPHAMAAQPPPPPQPLLLPLSTCRHS